LGICTSVLNNGLCCGPVFLKKKYLGSSLNFFKLNSCSLVLESIKVTVDFNKYSSQKLRINFSTDLRPPSKYMAPTIASKQSLLILSADLSSFLCEDPNKINFFKLIFLAISKHVFLFTKLANFLSIIPSFSSGYLSKSFSEITKPKTLSPKNSNFSLLYYYQNFYELMLFLIMKIF
jgi:hypothetical protein